MDLRDLLRDIEDRGNIKGAVAIEVDLVKVVVLTLKSINTSLSVIANAQLMAQSTDHMDNGQIKDGLELLLKEAKTVTGAFEKLVEE